MNELYQVPWTDLLWQGLTEDGGKFLRGQLFRIGGDYYICNDCYYGYYQEDENSTIMIRRWHKIVPFTLERVEYEEVDEREEQEYLKNVNTKLSQEDVNFLKEYNKKYRELVDEYRRNRPKSLS